MVDSFHLPIPPALSALADALHASPPVSLADFTCRLSPMADDVSWIDALINRALAQWRNAPLRDVPLRGFGNGPMAGITVAQRPSAGIALGLLDSLFDIAGDDSQIVFDESFSLTILLAGGPITVERFDRSNAAGPISGRKQLLLSPGDRLFLDHNISQMFLTSLDRDAVFLRVGCSHADAAPTALIYDRASGFPVGEVCTDIAGSRMMALIDLAVTSGRADTGAVIAQLASHRLPALRWQAARHWLMLDAAAALPAIADMAANDPDPAIRAAATATCAMIDALPASVGTT